ncbi:MAG: arginine--tRNA ligase [Minisyncoccia bacterium]
MEERIEKAVQEYLAQAGAPETVFVVERPVDATHGDYTTNAAFAAAKSLGKNPRELADSLARYLIDSLGTSVASHVSVAGPGFVNITLAREAVTRAVVEADAQGSEWGKGRVNIGQRVMVEYTDPNPFKEMHIGHLMSNAIGESIARLIESSGATVSRANYQGDVGLHVAKAIWGKQQKSEVSWGEAYVFGSEHYETHKEEIDRLNKTIYEKSDPAVNTLYDEGRAQSLEHFEKIYHMLGTTFAHYFFESDVGPIGLAIVQKHPEIFEKSEGAVVFKGEPYGLHTRVFINNKGLPTYEAKELGLVEAKKQKGDFDISLTITANEIQEYFKVVRRVAEMLFPDLEGKMIARFHGFLKLTTGKMSSRKGNVITALEFIEEVKEDASERNTDPLVAEQVAIGAIKYMVLRQAPGSDIIFDPEKSLSLEGDSGPYLQYALVRAKSVLAQVESGIWRLPAGRQAPDSPYLIERALMHFPEVVARAAREFAPNVLVTYLTELASEWNSFYAQERIIGGDHEAHKILVARAFINTMTNGLTLLGIPTPEKM